VKIKYSYWLFSNVISNKDRNKIKRIASDSGYSDATIRIDEYDNKDLSESGYSLDTKTRKSGVVFIDKQYLYNLFCPYINGANKSAGWNFNIDYFTPFITGVLL